MPKKRILSEEEIELVKNLASTSGPFVIASKLGMSHDCFCDIRKRDERVRMAYNQGKANKVAQLDNHFFEMAKTNPQAAMFLYKNILKLGRDPVEERPEYIKLQNENTRLQNELTYLKYQEESKEAMKPIINVHYAPAPDKEAEQNKDHVSKPSEEF